MKVSAIVLAGVTASLVYGGGHAAAADAGIQAADRKFVVDARRSGDLSIALSQLAVQRTGNPAVTQFAQKVIADQTATTKRLTQIATLDAIAFPPSDAGAAKEVEQLGKLNGAAFDKLYAKLEVKQQAELMKLFRQQEHDGQDKQISRLAGDTLPIYEEDSDKAEQLVKAVAKTK